MQKQMKIILRRFDSLYSPIYHVEIPTYQADQDLHSLFLALEKFSIGWTSKTRSISQGLGLKMHSDYFISNKNLISKNPGK